MNANASGKTKKDWRAFAKRDWLAFDRADFLGAKIILGYAVVGSILFGLGGPILDAVRNAPLSVSYTTKVTSGIELPRGATHDGNATMGLPLMGMFAIALVGEAFRRGVQLREDVEGLV